VVVFQASSGNASLRADVIADHRAPASGSTIEVTRDNPAYFGKVDLRAGEEAHASHPWSHNGTWVGLGGTFYLNRPVWRILSNPQRVEVWDTAWHFANELVPTPGDTIGPAETSWRNRAGNLGPGGHLLHRQPVQP
jgi:hypothetical protein